MRATVLQRADAGECFGCGEPIAAGAVRAEFEGLTLCMVCGVVDDERRDVCARCNEPIGDEAWITILVADDDDGERGPTGAEPVEAPIHLRCDGRPATTREITWPNW